MKGFFEQKNNRTLCFMQKFNMTGKNRLENDFWQKVAYDCVYPVD